MLAVVMTRNGMMTFHKMTSIWRSNLDLWRRQKLVPPQEWTSASSDMKSAARGFMGRQEVGGPSAISSKGKELLRRNLVVVGHVKVKASRQTSSGPMSGGVAQGQSSS